MGDCSTGTALAFACAQFGLDCEIWQVRASYDQKPYRKIMIETFGGTIHPSPSDRTEAGRNVLATHPDSPGSLGIAISEDADLAALERMAQVTGGNAYLAAQPEDILGVFAQAVLSR